MTLSPVSQSKGVVIVPHGGPHSVITDDFEGLILYVAMAASGYKVLLVNYPGSIGYGQECVLQLVGKVGTLDVDMCHKVAETVGVSGKVVVCGGSHGGFIAAHLLGRYPEFYAGGIMRNPVTDIGGMAATTDIPDWCWLECGLEYNLANPPVLTPEVYKTMWEMSPVSSLDRVKARVLLLLGKEDHRVPSSQGRCYGEALRARGVDVQLEMFHAVGHALDTVEAERMGLEKIASFLKALFE